MASDNPIGLIIFIIIVVVAASILKKLQKTRPKRAMDEEEDFSAADRAVRKELAHQLRERQKPVKIPPLLKKWLPIPEEEEESEAEAAPPPPRPQAPVERRVMPTPPPPPLVQKAPELQATPMTARNVVAEKERSAPQLTTAGRPVKTVAPRSRPARQNKPLRENRTAGQGKKAMRINSRVMGKVMPLSEIWRPPLALRDSEPWDRT